MTEEDGTIQTVPVDNWDLVPIAEDDLLHTDQVLIRSAEGTPAEDILEPVTTDGGEGEARPAAATKAKGKKKAEKNARPAEGEEDLSEGDKVLDAVVEDILDTGGRRYNVAEPDMALARLQTTRLIDRENRTRPKHPLLLHGGGRLVGLEEDEAGRIKIVPMTTARLRNLLDRVVHFYRPVGKGKHAKELKALPPLWLCDDIMIAPLPGLPILDGIRRIPIITRTGQLQTDRGFCAESRLYFDPVKGQEIPAVSKAPTDTEIAWARDMITKELLGDFPFVSEGELAAAVALLLLPFVRCLVDGPAPLHLVEKPAPGTGATLLVQVITLITQGHPVAGMMFPASDDELDKRLLAAFRSGSETILFDNICHRMDSSPFAMALTAGEYIGRVLGSSTNLCVKINCTLIATGNNPRLSEEITRRTLRIRLDAKSDNPWRRPPTTFRHKDLLQWARKNRGKLICAALTLGMAWVSKGRPAAPENPPFGMFEVWAEVLGGILHVAGIPGFLTNLDALSAASDDESATLRIFIGAWWHAHGTALQRVSDLFKLAQSVEPPLALGDRGEISQKIKLGQSIAEQRDRQFSICLDENQAAQWEKDHLSVRVISAGTIRNAQVWKLEPVP